jgi:tetratricopeptide (TPR) repeat protein
VKEDEMKRYPVAVLMCALIAGPMTGQSVTSTPAVSTKDEFPEKPELLRRIGLYETAARHAEEAHTLDGRLISVYLNLGGMYEVAAMYPRAEDAIARAISLIRSGVKGDLPQALLAMGSLHVGMGEFRKAERDENEALRLQEATDDRKGMAQSWGYLAATYFKEKKYDQAIDDGQRAMDLLGSAPHTDAVDRIAVRQTLANAYCMLGDCERGLPLLRESLEIAKTAYGEDSPPAALAYYLLGYTSWRAGDRVGAQAMERGLRGMKGTLGWGHPVYVQAMKNYALFLRESGQVAMAGRVEGEVRQAEAVVDARTFTHLPTMR